MKRYRHIILSMLTALCFSCTDTVEEMPDAGARAVYFSISDSANVQHQSTRSDMAFAAGDKIGIFACYRDTNNSPTIFSPNFMHNQPVAYDGNIWTYSPTKYWPSDGSVDFFGYYPYDVNHQEIDDAFHHECVTGFERLYGAHSLVKADNNNLSGSDFENDILRLNFLPLLNRVHFRAVTAEGLFDEVDEELYKDCRFLIREFRIWGFPKNSIYSIHNKQWIWSTDCEYYTKEDPLDLSDALKKVNIEEVVPGYKYDPAKGYDTQRALIVLERSSENTELVHFFNQPANLIPLTEEDPDNEPMFQVVYVVLTNPKGSQEYKESGIVTRSGSLKEAFSNKGLIKKNLHINIIFSVDGVTVTCNLYDYNHKPMF